jgi:hypothetical protein
MNPPIDDPPHSAQATLLRVIFRTASSFCPCKTQAGGQKRRATSAQRLDRRAAVSAAARLLEPKLIAEILLTDAEPEQRQAVTAAQIPFLKQLTLDSQKWCGIGSGHTSPVRQAKACEAQTF